MIMYAIRHAKTKEVFHFSISSNDGRDNCDSYSVEISPKKYIDYARIWMTDKETIAEATSISSTKWYNADFEHPMYHESYVGRMEVFKIKMEIM